MQVFQKEITQISNNERQSLLANDKNNKNKDKNAENPIDMKSFLTACAANLYEYYDFALLGFFASEISTALFPSTQGATAIIQLYSLYAVGFVARPFGGMVFGWIGDRYGRKSALRMAMILMSFPTFLTGCIPPYEYIGYWAPFCLLILRILQGLSTGGENSSASIYIYETAPQGKRAFWLSVFAICSSGTLIASLSHVILEAALTTPQLLLWGWRLPFMLGLGLFFYSLWAKKWLKTTETFSDLEETPLNVHHNPIKYMCMNNRGILFKFILSSALQHGSAYMIFVFLPSFLSSSVMRGNDHWIDSYAYSNNCINSIIFLPICVIIGYYADKIGTICFLSISCIIVIFGAPFLFYGLSISTSSMINWFLQFLLVLCCVPMWGCIYFWYISVLLIDPRTRVSVYGVGYNLGAAVFGGTASLIGTSLVSSMGPIDGMIWSGIWMSVMATMAIGTIGFVEFFEKPYREKKRIENKGKYKAISEWKVNKYHINSNNALSTITEATCEDDDDEESNESDQSEHTKLIKVYG